ncbi:MAG: heavy-metal-associated domain-containing protein [Candidatus Magasanikbacteria bacterium]|nr:heavy-metal-associated domain-containing protein [Candidatus Magasanikbacteria bacterium]
MPNQKFVITNLTCAACVKLSTLALKKIPGVSAAAVDLATGAAEITGDRDVAWKEIEGALKSVDKTAAQIT